MQQIFSYGSSSAWESWLNKWFRGFLLLGILVNASGLLLPILEPDGALYALLSKNMVLSGDYVQLKLQGNDWLDKPHFPFWITALSFKLFGINSFAYKIPGLIFSFIGACYTYAFAKRLYSIPAAKLAILIYLSAEHLILSNNDVRAEPYLTGMIIATTYHFYCAYKENKWRDFFLGSFFLAMAVMTKGIFITGIVASGFIIEWMVKKRWDQFLNYRWWVGAILLLLFIMPELICLYLQFDLHPEKTVFGRNNVSGVRFFFWDSQFGRFMNTGPIKGKGDLFFYLHTLIWAFLPWSIIFYISLGNFIKRTLGRTQIEDYVAGGICLCGFLLFSISRFQLPHYLNILYPFFAILLSRYFTKPQIRHPEKSIAFIQNFIYFIFFAGAVSLALVIDLPGKYLLGSGILLIAFLIIFFFLRASLQQVFARSFLACMVINLFLNLFFYPALFKYQSGMQAAFFINSRNSSVPVYILENTPSEYSFEFYSRQSVKKFQPQEIGSNPVLLFASKSKMDSLNCCGLSVKEIARFEHFPISRLNGKFINSKTREQTLEENVVALVRRP